MLAAEALATLPSLTCVDEDLDADRQALIELAEWAQRYSPIVGLEDAIAPTCLFLDMTGGAACFGGEDALLEKARAEFNVNGWTATIALADTLGAAWAYANFLPSPLRGRGVGGEGEGSNILPIAALRLSSANAALLRQLGIERIGQLLELPRDEVAVRFGPEVGLRLDQLTGRAREVIAPIHPEPEATASWVFDDPVERHDILVKVFDLLLERLQTILEQRRAGTRLIECTLELDGVETQRFECSLSRPAQTARYLSGLLRLKLEQIRVAAPIRALCVRAAVLERCADEQPSLFDAGCEIALSQLLDSLTSRLGNDAVTVPHAVADPQPELACRFEPAILRIAPAEKRQDLDSSLNTHRPLRLFFRPLAIEVRSGELPIVFMDGSPHRDIRSFHHAGVDHVVVRCQGPERIETGWWRGADVQRDYYLVETADGTRWWLFHRFSDERWFLHGCFD